MNEQPYMWSSILSDIIKEHGEDAPVTVWSPSGSWELMPAGEASDYIYRRFDVFDIDSVGVSYTTPDDLDEQIVVSREYNRRMMGLQSDYQVWASNSELEEHDREENMCNRCLGTGETQTGGMCPQCQGSGFSKEH